MGRARKESLSVKFKLAVIEGRDSCYDNAHSLHVLPINLVVFPLGALRAVYFSLDGLTPSQLLRGLNAHISSTHNVGGYEKSPADSLASPNSLVSLSGSRSAHSR